MQRSLLLMFLALAQASIAQNNQCVAYNTQYGPTVVSGPVDYTEHTSGGYHAWSASYGASCQYSGDGTCAIAASASAVPYALTEKPPVSAIGHTHYGDQTFKGGSNSSSGAAISVDAEGAADFKSCLFSCAIAPTVTGAGAGGGFSVVFPATTVYAQAHHYGPVTCQPQSTPPPGQCPNVPASSIAACTAAGGSWNYSTCTCIPPPPPYGSPILIDTNGHGFHLSDPRNNCVVFDLENNGKPACWSWPERGSRNAWLVLDIDHDHDIDSGAELFGNFTAHSDGDYFPIELGRPNPANGFTALGFWDQPGPQGGNQDGIIDATDGIWKYLRLWIPDHCFDHPGEPCHSIPKELHKPEEFHIHAFGIEYAPSPDHDDYGNQFRLFSQANPRPNDNLKPDDELRELRMVDVFLVHQ